MVAARRLRKSMLKANNDYGNIDINLYNHKIKEKNKEDIFIKDNLGTFEEENNKTYNIKLKSVIKIFLSLIIIFSCLCSKLFFAERLKNNKYISYIIYEYNKDYTKYGCIEKFEDIVNSIYLKTKYIVPEELANKIKEQYITNIKNKLLDFEVKTVFNNIFSTTKSEAGNMNVEEDLLKNNNISIQSNNGIGGGGPIELDLGVEDASAVSTMQDNVGKVISKNIEIRKPVEGVLTSAYGAREQIFEGVNSYHTGIDIANKLSTPIKSATCGKVVKVEENNKYYGNFVEIETSGVLFKYAHLESYCVKIGEQVNFDTIIGYMGSTGMSTGSHLHFEIKIDGSSVDPRQVVSFY